MPQTSPRPQDEPTQRPPGHGKPGASGHRFVLRPSIPPQDLRDDLLLNAAPRVSIEGVSSHVPTLGGIPLLAKLGQGGMGAVYYGIHPRLEIEVAVKVLPFNLADRDEELIERFYREAKVAARVDSPNLVGVKDVNEEAGLYYIVMEYVQGASAGGVLRELVKTGKSGLPEATALDICIAAAQGLDVAHQQGIVHRDIKPDNVLIPKAAGDAQPAFGRAKLCDLGLARREHIDRSLTGSAAAMGTPGYMAPEQGLDAKRAGKPADVFSLGATLYALLVGQAPFAGSSVMKVMIDTAQNPPPPIRERRADISKGTEALIERCLAKDPTARFPDAASLLEALRLCRQTLGGPDSAQATAAAQFASGTPGMMQGTIVPTQRTPPVGSAVATSQPPAQPAKRRSSALLIFALLAVLLIPAAWFGHGEWQKLRKQGDGAGNVAAPEEPKGPAEKPTESVATPKEKPVEPEPKPEPKRTPQEIKLGAIEAQAGVEALREQIEKAEEKLNQGAEKDPKLARVRDLCERFAFGGPQRLATDKAYNFGKALMTAQDFAPAAAKFREAETALKAALSFRDEAERVLNNEVKLRSTLKTTLEDCSEKEVSFYSNISRALNGVRETLEKGKATEALATSAEIEKSLAAAGEAVASRRAADTSRKAVAALAGLPKFAADIRAGEDAFGKADLLGKQGQWDEAKKTFQEAETKCLAALKGAKREVDALLILARKEYKAGQFAEAMGRLNLVLKIDARNADALRLKPQWMRDAQFLAALKQARALESKAKAEKSGEAAQALWQRVAEAYALAAKVRPDSEEVKTALARVSRKAMPGLPWFRKAKDVARTIQEPENKARQLVSVASGFYRARLFSEADALVPEIIAAFQQIRDPMARASTRYYLTGSWFLRHIPESMAERCVKESFDSLDGIPDLSTRASYWSSYLDWHTRWWTPGEKGRGLGIPAIKRLHREGEARYLRAVLEYLRAGGYLYSLSQYARRQWKHGDRDVAAALDEATAAVRKGKSSDIKVRDLAAICLEVGDRTRADNALGLATATKRDGVRVESLLAAAARLREVGNHKGAGALIKEADAVVRAMPDWSSPSSENYDKKRRLLDIGRAHSSMGDPASARRAYDETVRVDGLSEAKRMKTASSERTRQMVRRRALDGELNKRLEVARTQAKAGDSRGAALTLVKVKRLSMRTHDIRSTDDRGRFRELMSRTLKKTKETSEIVWFYTMLDRLADGDVAGAKSALKVMTDVKARVKARNAMAQGLIWLGDVPAAAEAVRALPVTQLKIDMLLTLARQSNDRAYLEEARTKALSITDTSARWKALKTVASAQLDLGDRRSATKSALAAAELLKKSKGDYWDLQNVGETLTKVDDFAGAEELARAALGRRSDPKKGKYFQKAYEHIMTAICKRKAEMGKLAEAERLANSLPPSGKASALYGIGWKVSEKFSHREPESPDTRIFRGLALARGTGGAMKDREKAFQHFQEALRSDFGPYRTYGLGNLTWTLATEKALLDERLAPIAARKLMQVAGNRASIDDLNKAAAGFARGGDFKRAVELQEEVIRRKGREWNDYRLHRRDGLLGCRIRLHLYREGKAFLDK